ncbi:unnamed protein product [Litomosoides sigmodontis]|uniref:MARVEL domain-containing protein n=1 Tax=Litomosoides sigmodontis TaxID=42156 RepID=A0A3P6RV59_LITSI|nr:unnamed protein product [Litomosoides sigmodontis]
MFESVVLLLDQSVLLQSSHSGSFRVSGQLKGNLYECPYIKLVAAFLITAAALTFFAFFLNIFGLRSQDLHRKYVFYKFATYISLLGVFLELVSLIVFPVCFYVEMKNFGYRNWEFDWSYGVAWGATLFSFGASLLLICDKEHEEVYFKEKTIYNPPPELK